MTPCFNLLAASNPLDHVLDARLFDGVVSEGSWLYGISGHLYGLGITKQVIVLSPLPLRRGMFLCLFLCILWWPLHSILHSILSCMLKSFREGVLTSHSSCLSVREELLFSLLSLIVREELFLLPVTVVGHIQRFCPHIGN